VSEMPQPRKISRRSWLPGGGGVTGAAGGREVRAGPARRVASMGSTGGCDLSDEGLHRASCMVYVVCTCVYYLSYIYVMCMFDIPFYVIICGSLKPCSRGSRWASTKHTALTLGESFLPEVAPSPVRLQCASAFDTAPPNFCATRDEHLNCCFAASAITDALTRAVCAAMALSNPTYSSVMTYIALSKFHQNNTYYIITTT
jgi:hypothetical protein